MADGLKRAVGDVKATRRRWHFVCDICNRDWVVANFRTAKALDKEHRETHPEHRTTRIVQA